MKLILVCVGNLKAGPEKALFDHYKSRITWPFEIREVVNRKEGTAQQVKEWEGDLLMAKIEPDSVIIGLDERGKSVSSTEFAQMLGNWRDDSVRSITFIIGGADGLSDAVRQRCHRLISFGQMTWPHMLVRGMLAEQLYRSQQILIGHPYHRE
jgi:23S rRNA (pseudouridine1915-N3)-methyltransferase